MILRYLINPNIILILISIIPIALSSYCGQSAVPFTFQVLRSGHPVLGCARPRCFGWDANGTRAADSVQFYRINGKEDGYLRRSDQYAKIPAKHPSYQSKTSICSDRYSDKCREDEWVGGLAPQEEPQKTPLKIRCCAYHMLEVAEDRGIATVKQGQLVVGGEYMEADRLLGFDYIANLQKNVYANGTIYYSVQIKRMQCEDDDTMFSPSTENTDRNQVELVQGGSQPAPPQNAASQPSAQVSQQQPSNYPQPRVVQPSPRTAPQLPANNVQQPVVNNQIQNPYQPTSNIQPLANTNTIAQQGVTTAQGYPQLQAQPAGNQSPYGQYYQQGYGVVANQVAPQAQTGQIGLPSPFSPYQFQHPLTQPQATPDPFMALFSTPPSLFPTVPTIPPVTMPQAIQLHPQAAQLQPQQIQQQQQIPYVPQTYQPQVAQISQQPQPTYYQPQQQPPATQTQQYYQPQPSVSAGAGGAQVPVNYAQLPPQSQQPVNQQQYANYQQYYQQNYQQATPTPFPTMPTISIPKLEDLPKIEVPSIEDVENVIPPVQKAILTSVAKFFGVL